MSANLELEAGKHTPMIRRLCRSLSEFSPQPMVAVEGSTHVVIYLNTAFAQLVGRERKDLVGRPFAEAVPEGEANGCLTLLDRVFRTGVPEILPEQEHCHASTGPAFWTYSVWAILGEDDRPAGVMIQVTDSTEIALYRKHAADVNESLLISALRQHELAQTAEDLNARLKVAGQHKDRFLAVLSHELRTPLTPVLLAVSLLRRHTRLDDETRDLVEMIERNILLEARLIDDLLDMTRVERGEIHLERRAIDLRMVIKRALEVCNPDSEARGLTLKVDLGENPIPVEADPDRLQQVIWNLLRNAIKFSPVGGHVRVGCRREDSSAVVEVSDDGVGIDPELLPWIFNAFQQGDVDQRRKFGGLGLGLTISKKIVDLHGGTISARSDGKGKGSTFSVTLPIPAGAPPVEAENDPAQEKLRRPVRPLRILLVEDHVDGTHAFCQLLTEIGHTVQWAPDVTSALRFAKRERFDLLISDLDLPDGSGLDLMRTFLEEGSTLTGIILSGYGQQQDIAQSRDAGFAVHLTKPIDFRTLEAVISKLSDSEGESRAEASPSLHHQRHIE